MSNMVTRCPKCATAFRITSTQLQSAKGAVRCGSCLHIFKAQDHLVSGTAPSAESAVVRQPVAKQPSTATVRPVIAPKTSAAPIANPVAPPTPPVKPAAPATITAAKPAAPASKQAPSTVKAPQPQIAEQPAASADKRISASEKAVSANKPVAPPNKPAPNPDKLAFNQSQLDREIAASDEDDILISDDMYKPKSPKDEYSFDGFLDVDGLPQKSSSLFERKKHQRDATDDDDSSADESWAESLLDDADNDNKIAAVKQQITHKERATPQSSHNEQVAAPSTQGLVFNLVGEVPSHEPSDNDLREIFTEEELREEMRATHGDDNALNSPAMHAYDTSRSALLMNIMPEPVEMTASRKPQWQRRKLWPWLSLAMAAFLILQLGWLQFDHLSRIQPYRAGYEFICPWVGCTLPIIADRSQIRVRNLVVSKHRDIENALKVDVILINSASFEQPFPDLFIAFSSLDEKPLASRRFSPSEYLAGELAGYKLMPQGRPIHISLELVDPGEEAVNYKIEPL